MDISIKCLGCGEILGFGNMAKQSIKQCAKQAFYWKVMLGLQKIEWIPTCENCGIRGSVTLVFSLVFSLLPNV